MYKPEVFTADELAKMRSDIRSNRVPGAYEPDKWSVSPFNRTESATSRLPKSIRLRDITLRTLEILPGVSTTEEQKLEFVRGLVEAGVKDLVTAGRVHGRTVEAMRIETNLAHTISPDAKIAAICFSPADIEKIVSSGYDSVQVWLPPWGEASLIYESTHSAAWRGEDWRDLPIPKDREGFISRAIRTIKSATAQGLDVTVCLLMVSYYSDIERFSETCRALASTGVKEIALFDGPGGVGPEAFATLVAAAKAVSPSVEIGVHPHNSFDLALACAIASARAGADVIEVSVNGYCGGPGNADLSSAAAAFEALYGISTAIDLSHLTRLARLGEEITGYHVAWNHPVTGTEVFNWGGAEFLSQEPLLDPMLHNCISPISVGNVSKLPVTEHSGPFVMATKMESLGFDEGSREQIERILVECQAMMRGERRIIGDEEITSIVRSILGTDF